MSVLQAYKNSGDTASKKGGRIWIAEMYGYSFGAAKVDVWHYYKEDFFLYPSYTPGSESQLQSWVSDQMLLPDSTPVGRCIKWLSRKGAPLHSSSSCLSAVDDQDMGASSWIVYTALHGVASAQLLLL